MIFFTYNIVSFYTQKKTKIIFSTEHKQLYEKSSLDTIQQFFIDLFLDVDHPLLVNKKTFTLIHIKQDNAAVQGSDLN